MQHRQYTSTSHVPDCSAMVCHDVTPRYHQIQVHQCIHIPIIFTDGFPMQHNSGFPIFHTKNCGFPIHRYPYSTYMDPEKYIYLMFLFIPVTIGNNWLGPHSHPIHIHKNAKYWNVNGKPENTIHYYWKIPFTSINPQFFIYGLGPY